MALIRVKLGDYITRSTKNNNNLHYGHEIILGVTSEGVFALPKTDVKNVNLKPYKVVENSAFVYNPSRLDIGSIAYREDGLCIVSHLYQVFYLNEKGKKYIDPKWLFIYFKRKEFLREVTFRNFGSQRPEFNYSDMCEIELEIPSIEIQKKYVAVYEGMIANLKTYEKGLEDLKLVCDGFIEELRKKNKPTKLRDYINLIDQRNNDKRIVNVKSVSISKTFNDVGIKVNKNELGNYKVVNPNNISYVQTTGNEKCFAFAINDTNENIVVTSVNNVFTTNSLLNPYYLGLWFRRKEFDRYARFISWGSARETVSWDDLLDYKIPIPDSNVQNSIVQVYKSMADRKKFIDKLKQKISTICPILIRGSIMEAQRGD